MVQGVRLVTSAFYGQGFPEGQELGGEGGETLRFSLTMNLRRKA
jgi:hypothetical protein